MLLTARELGGEVIFTFFKMKAVEGVGGLDEAMGSVGASIKEGKSDVFDDGKIRDKVEVLKNKANFFGTEAGFFSAGEGGDILVVEMEGARGGVVEEAENVKKGGFTTARGTHNHDKFTTLNGEAEIIEGENFSIRVAVGFGEVFDFDEGLARH